MRVLVTGSAEGLGRLAAASLLESGHEVVLHVRNQGRASAVADLLARGAGVVVGDLASVPEAAGVADQANALGRMDAVIHNAGVDSGPSVAGVNVIAPYMLTASMLRPDRLVYLSSSMHRGGRPSALDQADWAAPRSRLTYSDSKLFVTTLALAVARLWPDVRSNAVDPGWVPTRMGGPSAPDDLGLGHLTQEWLATSDDPEALGTGGYWHHQRRSRPHPAALDERFHERLLGALAERTALSLQARP